MHDKIIKKILELNITKINILRDEETTDMNFTELNTIFGAIVHKIPTLITNNNQIKVVNNRNGLETPHKTFDSELLVILKNAHTFDFQNMKKYLDYIAKSHGSLPKAKLLLILLADSKSLDFDLEKLLLDAWSLKFLDFSILKTDDHNNWAMQNYNPFFETYQRHNLVSAQIFPDKMKNMNGYKIKTVLYNRPPHIEFINNSNEIHVNGINFAFLQLTSAALNYTFDYREITDENLVDDYVLKKIENGKIDVSIMTHILGIQLASSYIRGDFLIGKVVRSADMSLVVPIFFNTFYELEIDIIFHSCLTSLIILVTMVIVRISKFKSDIWSPLYIFGLLFGITVNKIPKRCFEKLLYLSLAIISIKYSSDVLAAFTDNEVVKKEETVYDAIEEMKRPSLPLYLHNTYFQDKENNGDEVIQSMLKNSIKVTESYECYEKLSTQMDRFCFDSSIWAGYMIKQLTERGKPPKMKSARPIILGDFFVHVFAKGSPYIKKFDQKFQEVFEAGLQDSILRTKMYTKSVKSEKQIIKFEPNVNVINQLILFALGCSFGVLTFALEFFFRSKKIISTIN